MKKVFVLLIFVFPLLSSCISLDRNDCVAGDWYARGISDVQNGLKNRFGRYQETCGGFAVTVDQNQYLAGRKKGLKTACKVSNAFAHGMGNVGRFSKICNDEAYQVYYRVGTQLGYLAQTMHQLQKKAEKTFAKVHHTRNRLEEIHRRNVSHQREKQSDKQILDQLHRSEATLKEQIRDLKKTIKQANTDFRQFSDALKNSF